MSFIGGYVGAPLTPAQIYSHAVNAGFSGNAAITATAIGLAESSGIPNNFNPLDPHGGSVGLMQINGANAGLLGGQNWIANGVDPAQNMQAAYAIYSQSGGFGQWGAYNNGSYQRYMSQAQAAASGVGAGTVTGVPPVQGQGVSAEPSATGSTYGDITGFSVAGVGDQSGIAAQSPALAGGSPSENPYESIPSVSTPSVSSTESAQTQTGQPVNITDASLVGQQAGQNIESGANTLAKSVGNLSQGIGTAETNLGTTATSLLQSLLSALQGWFVQFGFITIGLIVIAGAFLFFYMERKDTSIAVVNA
jgi:Lysozyme like domain